MQSEREKALKKLEETLEKFSSEQSSAKEAKSHGVGKIVDGKLTNVSRHVLWDADVSLCIILRDIIREFTKKCLPNDGAWFDENDPADEEYLRWCNDRKNSYLQTADKFDEYINADVNDAQTKEKIIKEACAMLAEILPGMWQ